MGGKPGTARAGLLDLVRLGARMGMGLVARRRRFDAASVACRWARALLERDGGDELRIDVAGRSVHMVTSRARSAEILAAEPGSAGYGTGPMKRDAMAFLAPGALTVAEGERWARLRAFNEAVLCPGSLHPLAPDFLSRVREAFQPPVRSMEDVRSAMGRAMVGIVLGEVGSGQDPAGDVRALFDAVQSPLKRKLLGSRYDGRRERLYGLLERCWEEADGSEPTLLGRARTVAPDLPRDEVLQQVPHWMFTFTGSGSDLLGRTLALITSRPEVLEAAVDEIRSAGDPGEPETVQALGLVNDCLRETGRLFPPVTRTFHRRTTGDGSDAGAQLVHWFPMLQRDPALGASVHTFVPRRWRAAVPDPAAAASNLFLRGPRACPGESLILFVCRAALARQLGEIGMEPRTSRLSRDPLPVSFPEREARFIPEEAS